LVSLSLCSPFIRHCLPAPAHLTPDLIDSSSLQSYTNMPIRAVTWRDPKTTLHNQVEGPHRGGRMDTRADLTATAARPYSKFTVYPKGPHALRTQNQTSSSYHGLMFAVRAGKDAIRITKLHTCCVGNPRKELYRIYIKHGHFLEGVIDPSKWREVACGETELPCTPNTYGEVPWPHEGIKIQAGEVMSIYVHCPYNKQVSPYRVLSPSPSPLLENDKERRGTWRVENVNETSPSPAPLFVVFHAHLPGSLSLHCLRYFSSEPSHHHLLSVAVSPANRVSQTGRCFPEVCQRVARVPSRRRADRQRHQHRSSGRQVWILLALVVY